MKSRAEQIAYLEGLVAAYEATRLLGPCTKRLKVWVQARLEPRLQELKALQALQNRETNPELH